MELRFLKLACSKKAQSFLELGQVHSRKNSKQKKEIKAMQKKLLFSTSSIRRKMKILESIKLENIDKSLMESQSSILLLKIKVSKEE